MNPRPFYCQDCRQFGRTCLLGVEHAGVLFRLGLDYHTESVSLTCPDGHRTRWLPARREVRESRRVLDGAQAAPVGPGKAASEP